MGFRPCEVVDAVSGVEEGEFGDGGGVGGGKVEDVETAVAEDAEVLRSGDCETVFVEWTEFYGVAVEWGLEHRHDN